MWVSSSFLLNKLYGYRKKGPGLTCISLVFLSSLTSLPKQCRDCKLAPCEDKIQLIQFVAFFRVVFSVLFWGLFFLVEAESLLYLGDQHLGNSEFLSRNQLWNSARPWRFLKGKSFRERVRVFVIFHCVQTSWSVILNNFESVANLSTIRVLHQNPHSLFHEKSVFWQPG